MAFDPDVPLSEMKADGPAGGLEALFSRLRARELRALAARHGVELTQARAKRELVAALMNHPAAPVIAEEARLRLEALEGGQLVPAEPGAELSEDERLLRESLATHIEFARATELRDQARAYFEGGDFEQAIRAAEGAGRLAGANAVAFQRAIWAYVILASQRIIEGCERAKQPVENARSLLQEAMEAFRGDAVGDRPETVTKLAEVSRTLHAKEVARVRSEVSRIQAFVAQVANTGASVLQPELMLRRARDALRGHDPFDGAQLVAEAERLADEILRARIQEIETAIPETAAMIDEARNVGAAVEEAEHLLEEAKAAASAKEYVSASELVHRAERAAIASQHRQIEIAMDLRRRQLEKAEEVLQSFEPLIAEAEEFGQNVMEARIMLRQARDILAKEDYVNGMIFARNAAEIARRLEPAVVEERARRGIRMPTSGVCGSCGSTSMTFQSDGWGACRHCGHKVPWRRPARLLDRFTRVLRR